MVSTVSESPEAVETVEAPESEHPLASLIPPLVLADRCCFTGCSAQAFAAVLVTADNDHPLLFCGHHAARVLPTIPDPFAVRDDRHLINQTSESSA